MDDAKLDSLATQIFTAYPKVEGLKFYFLDCGCIHYNRVYTNGRVDAQTGIYRDSEDGPCETCMLKKADWKDRILDETVVYDSNFRIVEI